MAERRTCQTLTSSIHSEDFLSDVELLPATTTPTPVKQTPHSQPATPYTSKVTAQLYASLQQSRQAEAEALSHLENQHGLSVAKEAKAPEVDLDTLAEEMSLRLSTGVETSAYRKGGAAAESRHISEMENVRSHLQSMLRESRDAADGEALGLGNLERKDDDSFESDSTTALLNARPLQEDSPPGSMLGFEELFPRYTSLRFGQVHVREHTSYGDAHLLKDSLGKEQARRKLNPNPLLMKPQFSFKDWEEISLYLGEHCERHIHNLQNRILELQQQLAVAISSDKKKNAMIEQLDKTLAKVVEGWNRHETERTAALRRLQTEKEAMDQALERQKEKVAELEGQLQQSLATLNREQQTASLYRKEKEALEEEKESLLCKLEAADQRACSLEAEWDLERRQQEVLRVTLEEQQRAWGQRERQLEQQCQALQEEGRAQLDKERAAAQREAQKATDAQRILTAVQEEVQGLEAKLETVCRERDNLKLELNLVKARFDAQKVKLESELKVALEERVTERLTEVHEESLRQMSAMREQHRKQLLELSSHHEQEMASQLGQFKSDLAEREERHRHLCENYERRLSRQVEEIRELQVRQRRLEVQRAEMVSQFQAMMQAHWNEALNLFTCTSASPQSAKQDASSEADHVSDSEFLKPSEPHKKHQNAETLGSSHSGRDCEGPAWNPAVTLHPRTQSSSLQGPSEGPEKSMQDSYQHFFPLLPDAGRFSSDFSHILNCSLLSQQGFQQLEAQVDRTRMDPGLPFHPDNLAEHPFTDDTDETTTEVVGSEGDTPQHSSLESAGQAHQPDLNFCMQLLFDRSSNESCSQKQEGFSMSTLQHPVNQTQFATSLSYHERPTALWDGAQPVRAIRIQPSSNPAVHKTKVPLSKSGSACQLEPTSPIKQNPVHEGGIPPTDQVAEVARLLKQYQITGRPAPTTEELYKYLHVTIPNGSEMKSGRNLHARRNLDPKLSEAGRKEAPPTRRAGSSGSGREKSGTSAKAGKKLSGVHGSSSRTSRGGGVWR